MTLPTQRWRLIAVVVLIIAIAGAATLRVTPPSTALPATPTRAALAAAPTVSADQSDSTLSAAAPTQADTAAAPTERPTLPPPTLAPAAALSSEPSVTPPPTSEPVALAVPSAPVPGQAVITFAPEASPAERSAYLAAVGATVQQEIGPLHTVVVSLPPDAAPLPPSPLVAASEPDHLVIALQDAPVSDPLYPQQWALPVIGAPTAWAVLPTDARVISVAVIDSGICADHPDLAGRVLPGWDFVENDADPQDVFGHGCAVAGVIAAAHDGAGIAGVAPNARILPLRVLDAQGTGTYSNVAAAIIQAADRGAQVINLSLGGAAPSALMADAVDYAVARGVTVIAAAGNTGGSVLYPAALAPVVAVASVDADLQRSGFSSYGPEIDLYAPGRDILTTRPGGAYAALSGTSFAAPQVAGTAALELALGRQLALTGGVVAVGGAVTVVFEPTPLPPDAPLPDGQLPDSAWPGGRRPPLRVMVPHPDVAAQMAAEATSMNQMFPQMALTGAFEPGPRIITPQIETFKALALLVEFTDQPRNTGIAVTSFDSLLFSSTAGVKSVRNYYRETSYNQLDIVSVSLPSAVGWRTAPQPKGYYVNGQKCLGNPADLVFPYYSYPNNCQKLVENLVQAVNAAVDFSQYDNNGDGWVDTLMVIHAGPGAEVTGSAADIWSHQWGVVYAPLVDGVRVGSYTMQPEYIYIPGDLTIGVLAHELGHAFGLIDLYDVDNSSAGVGNWSLMSGGSWNGPGGNGSSPAHLDAWSKVYMGFTTPQVVTTSQPLTLPNAVQNSAAVRINTSRAGEYFLVENRQRVGYDTSLPGAGLLVWHIDDAASGNSRECRQHSNWLCGANRPRVALEQADGALDLEYKRNGGDGSDPFPGIGGRREFNPTTLPNTSSYYTGAAQFFGLFSISNPGMTMTAQFRVIVPVPALSAPADGADAATQQPTFTWLPVAGVAGYEVQMHPSDPALAPAVYVTASSYTPSAALDVGVTYYWRVRALDASGNQSDWSAPRSVRIVSPPNVAPARNRFTSDQPLLTWGRISGAAAYQVQVARSPSFVSANVYDTGVALSAQVSAPAEGLYYWRVRAQLSSGAWGPWSAADTFTIDLP